MFKSGVVVLNAVETSDVFQNEGEEQAGVDGVRCPCLWFHLDRVFAPLQKWQHSKVSF